MRSERVDKPSGGGLRGSQEDQNKQDLYQYQAGIRAGSEIRKKVLANGLCQHYMLTYADEVESREKALHDFKKFIQRLNYHTGKKVPYVAVIEVQEERKKKYGVAVLHFHFATSIKFNTLKLQEIWGHGIVRSSYHDGDISSISAYFSKYLKKDIEKCPREKGEKRFLASRGLKEPIKVKHFKSHIEIKEDKKAARATKDFTEEENPYIDTWVQITEPAGIENHCATI